MVSSSSAGSLLCRIPGRDELFQGCTAYRAEHWSGRTRREAQGKRYTVAVQAHSPGSRDASTPCQAISLVWSWLSHSPFRMPVYEGHLDLFAQLSILFTSCSSRDRLFGVRVQVPLALVAWEFRVFSVSPVHFGRWPSHGFGVPVSLLIPFWREFKWVEKDIWSFLIQCKWTLWWVNNFPFSFALLGYFNEQCFSKKFINIPPEERRILSS